MNFSIPRQRFLLAFLLVSAFIPHVANADDLTSKSRLWSDSSGNFSVRATLVTVTSDQAVLRREDNGKEIRVPLRKLSEEDRSAIKEFLPENESDPASVRQVTKDFFDDLRTQDRNKVPGLLTSAARASIRQNEKILAALPAPSKGKSGVRVGKIQVDGEQAVALVRVKVGAVPNQLQLHLKKESTIWKVGGISILTPAGPRKIDFENIAAMGTAASDANSDQKPSVPPKRESLVGKDMPLSGITYSGAELDMQQFRGKYVLIDFWATWCGPCRKEIPNILANYEKYHDKGFEVVAISVDKSMDTLNKYVQTEQPPWTIVADRHPNNSNSMSQRYKITGIPSVFLLGPDGKVVVENCRGARLGAALEKYLGS
ncbi:MAG: thioredoxin-like domain-containing protein [Planctomycetota bacterium]